MAALGLMVAPASAMLINGDFEAGTTGWGGNVELNSTIHNPGASPNGGNYGSAQAGGQNVDRTITQTVTGLTPFATYALDGYWASNSAGTIGTAKVTLTGDTADSDTVAYGNTAGFGWTPHNTLSAKASAAGELAIVYRVTTDGNWSNGAAIHVDGVTLTPEPGSLAILALAGLPMLRRRRRMA